jgi:hypothetical protein
MRVPGKPIEPRLTSRVRRLRHRLIYRDIRGDEIDVLPTFQDGQHWGNVANLQNEIQASHHDRTTLTTRFNTPLQSYCISQRMMIWICNHRQSIEQTA